MNTKTTSPATDALSIARDEFPDALRVAPCDDRRAAVVVRRVNLGMGHTHLCGYAVIDHNPRPNIVSLESEGDVPCHGGVTYDDVRAGGARVVGFDCAHYGDRGNASLTPEWCEAEARALAAWLLAGVEAPS